MKKRIMFALIVLIVLVNVSTFSTCGLDCKELALIKDKKFIDGIPCVYCKVLESTKHGWWKVSAQFYSECVYDEFICLDHKQRIR